jgi:Putative Ig domain/FG-GAP repeat
MQEHTLFNHAFNSSSTRSYPQHNKVSEDGSHAKRKHSVAAQQISGFPASFDLTTLNGANGFVVNGGRSIDYRVGEAVSTAGDINGDGKADLVLGAAQRLSDYVEVAFVIFGQSSFPAAYNLTTLNGTNGFVVTGTSDACFGCSVGTAGDVNGDGKDDLVLGAPFSYSNSGAAYVIFGQSSFPASFNVSTLNGTNGFVVDGLDPESRLGFSVNTAGDINGDGKADLVLGAPFSYSNSGAAYVIFGQSSFPASFNLSTLNGANGFVVNGLDSFSRLGESVNTAGDINGDGKADIVVGAPGREYALVIFGQSSFPPSFDILTLNGTNGFWVGGVFPRSTLGTSVSTAGDVNGDGKDDLVLGDPGAYGSAAGPRGAAYVIFGQSSFSSSFYLSTLNGTNGFVVYGIESEPGQGAFGYSVSAAGDINRDGKADIVVGAYRVSNYAGAAYVIFGQSSFPPSFNVSTLNGANGFVMNGISGNDFFGLQIGTAGDVKGDGKDGLVVSARGVSNNSGADYVIFQFNTAPVVINPIPDRTVMVNQPFNFTVLNNTFSDPDVDSLVYSAEQANGNLLPSWLAFNNKSGFFSGVAPTEGTTPLSVSARDPYGLSTRANFSLSAKTGSSSSSALLGTIVGSVVGGVLGVSALIGLGYGFYKKKCRFSSWLSRPQNSVEVESIESTPLMPKGQ